MSDKIKEKGREKAKERERERRETVAWLTIACVAAIEERGCDLLDKREGGVRGPRGLLLCIRKRSQLLLTCKERKI